MNRKNHLETYVSLQSINSDVIVACIDAFFPKVNKPTVIVVDPGRTHLNLMLTESGILENNS